MIARTEHTRPVLRTGDEPADLARARLLFDRLTAEGRPPRLRFPRKGVVPGPTALVDVASPPDRRPGTVGDSPDPGIRWLLDLATVAEGGEPGASPDISVAGLREIAVLLSSARRSAAHDLEYAFGTLARSPDRVRSDPRLRAFREECNRAVGAALKARPRFAWRLAFIPFVSAESVEDIVAARWRRKFGNHVVLAANSGYAAGRVTYAFRSAPDRDAADLFRQALPRGAPPPFVTDGGRSGRGALSAEEFAVLLANLKFKDPEVLMR